jgi:hypothetical protein
MAEAFLVSLFKRSDITSAPKIAESLEFANTHTTAEFVLLDRGSAFLATTASWEAKTSAPTIIVPYCFDFMSVTWHLLFRRPYRYINLTWAESQ